MSSFRSELERHLPISWKFPDPVGDYEATVVQEYTSLYNRLKSNTSGSFNKGIKKIVQVENPYLYGHFLLKQAEYKTRGGSTIKELYHDTGAHKIDSILRTNLNWRMAARVKFGQGVSFSPDPSYANDKAARSNGTDRAMIIADVLVGRAEHVNSCKQLPATGYDTTIGNRSKVYVKFYDDEFYPKYVVYYESRAPVVHRRRYIF